MLTSDMVSSVTTEVTGALNLIVPAALGIFAAIFGIKLLPRLINRFSK